MKSVWWFRPEPSPARDICIEGCRRNLAFVQAKLDEQAQQWADANGTCCPGCMFGWARTVLCEKAENIAHALMWMLRRRGRPEDLKAAKRYSYDYPERA